MGIKIRGLTSKCESCRAASRKQIPQSCGIGCHLPTTTLDAYAALWQVTSGFGSTVGTLTLLNFTSSMNVGPHFSLFQVPALTDANSSEDRATLSDANDTAVPPNPCEFKGHALFPSTYAELGTAAKTHQVDFILDGLMGWPKGHYLDAQPFASGTVQQNAGYGNYVFGVYMAAAGVSLHAALSAANTYAFFRSRYSKNTPTDPIYRSLPAANVGNITNGYSAERHGTLCD